MASTLWQSLFDLFDVERAAKGRDNGDFIFQPVEFLGGYRRKTRILDGRRGCHFCHCLIERLEGHHVADASAQFPLLGQGDECATLLEQGLVAGNGWCIRHVFDRCFDRATRHLQEFATVQP
jgi:hypothetical protein